MDAQKSPWAMGSLWVMQQSPPCSLPAELGCAGVELPVKRGSQEIGAVPGSGIPYANTTPTSELVPCPWGRGVQDAVPGSLPEVAPSWPGRSRCAPVPALGGANTEHEDGWMDAGWPGWAQS